MDGNLFKHLLKYPSGSLALYSLWNCKGESFLTLKYISLICSHYIKQSRAQWLTLLWGMLFCPSLYFFACHNSKWHWTRKWWQHKVQTHFPIKGLAQPFLRQAFNDIFSPVARLRLQAFSGNLGRPPTLPIKQVFFSIFLYQRREQWLRLFQRS